MKLYSFALSPFAARCRMQIRAKGLDIDIVDPPAKTTSDEWKAINPVGKVPLLDTGAMRIPECQVICEYLEDKFPEPSMLGRSAETTAMVRLLCRIVDLYVFDGMGPLFPQLRAEVKDQTVIAAQSEILAKGLGHLEHFIADGHYAVDNKLSLADCAVMPGIFFTDWMLKQLKAELQLTHFPKLAGYLEAIEKDKHAAATLAEMKLGLAAMMGG